MAWRRVSHNGFGREGYHVELRLVEKLEEDFFSDYGLENQVVSGRVRTADGSEGRGRVAKNAFGLLESAVR